MEINEKGLTTRELTVGYGKKVVIKDISISVESGKILTLIGPNGSGKSTVLKSITRQLKVLGGSIHINEMSMDDMKNADIAKSIAMVMTERIDPELMTCKEVVATGRYPYTGPMGILSKEDYKYVEDAMNTVNATETKDMSFSKISDGQRQRVMLARAICQDTDILVLDEPTSYLDIKYKIEILNNIRKMAMEKNLAVIMSLHELDLAQKISDYIACIDGDRIAKVGTPEEIFSGKYIQELYGINELNFSPLTGEIQFMGNKDGDKEPEVFVIGGGGSGIAKYHSLQRMGIPFVAGILHENDVEYETARAAALKVITAKAFYPIDEEDIKSAKNIIDKCGKCICTIKEFGPLNEANKQLAEYAKTKGKLMM